MFQAVASLFLFGTLSSMSIPPAAGLKTLSIASLPRIARLMVSEQVSASGIIVLDLLSGRELFAVDPDSPRPMASLAKLMTFAIVASSHDPGEIVTIPESVRSIDGQRADLEPGERYTVESLLAMTIIASANDAAYSLALYHSATQEAFVEAMNARAATLGLTQTHFENPVGFDAAEQYSTPRDLAWLASHVWQHPLARSFSHRKQYSVTDVSGGRNIVLINTNQLVHSHAEYFSGLKTGTTEAAGQCLISFARMDDRPYLFVVLKSADRYADTLALFKSLSLASSHPGT